MTKTKVVIRNDQKIMDVTSELKKLIKLTCSTALSVEEFSDDAEISVTLVDNEKIHKINKEFRNIDKETDVLSFPQGEDGVYDKNPENGYSLLGDIVISLEKAKAQSIKYDHSFEREVSYLTAHSMLHLLGFDHMNTEDKKVMRKEEKLIMKEIEL